MKKMLISTAMVAGILVLGGGFYLWPKGDPVTSNQTASSSVVKHKTTKKAVAKQVASAEDSQTTASKTASTSSSETASTSSRVSGENRSSDRATTTSSTSDRNPSQAGDSSSSSAVSQALSKSNLTTAQVDDWAWTQVKRQYSGADVTKQDFQFNQYQRNGLVYVDVYENQNDQVAHLAGRFRVSAAGNLEQQSLSNGSSWHVVSFTPAD